MSQNGNGNGYGIGGGGPIVIGVAGCSGSGKTSLAQELARELEGTHFHLDHYYRDLGHLTYEQRCRENFDHPNALEVDLLVQHVHQLATGHSIARPQYDFSTHTRVPGETVNIYEPHFLLVDGIFALHYEALRQLYHLKVFVDAPDAICYQRRLARDVDQRGRTIESVEKHYAETVRPMAEMYVRPDAQYADLVVDGTSSLDWSVEQVLGRLRQMKMIDSLEMTGFAGHS